MTDSALGTAPPGKIPCGYHFRAHAVGARGDRRNRVDFESLTAREAEMRLVVSHATCEGLVVRVVRVTLPSLLDVVGVAVRPRLYGVLTVITAVRSSLCHVELIVGSPTQGSRAGVV